MQSVFLHIICAVSENRSVRIPHNCVMGNAMTLIQFLKKSNITREQFAEMIGVDRVTVYRWETGKAFPIRHMARITAATGGKVTANDFYRGAA